jgi:diguanylate cyclase (GGDEF)-like protein
MQSARDHVSGIVLHVAAIVSWVLIAAGMLADAIVERGNVTLAEQMLSYGLPFFFLLILGRLVIAMITQAGRRRPLFALICAVTLWAGGSTALNSSRSVDLTKFPSPGEWLFLASYIGFAAFLILDAQRFSKTLTTWLEAIVICGGTACVAGALLLTPVASKFGRDGLPLLVAIIYPLIDVILATLVVAQMALRARGGWRESSELLLGFVMFACADAQLVTNLASGTYEFSVINSALYGLAFALVIGAACRRRVSIARFNARRQSPALMICASGVAILVLALLPDSTLRPYIVAPAVVTLLAAGGRLVVALREANQAAAAFALSRSDDLTLLPNRRAVLAMLDEQLVTDEPLALMILDLDGFKDVNDTLGHAAGDAVLQLLANRMRNMLPPEVLLARLGGDEFALVLPDNDPLPLMESAQAVLEVIRSPLVIDGIALMVDASIGITYRYATDQASSELLRRADVAMYHAKHTRAGAVLYDAHDDDFSRQKLQLSEELRTGLLNEQLVLWYQPQIDAATQQVCGLEALIRWHHPDQGLLSPAMFLPAARRAGLMQLLSEEVARIATKDLRRWRAAGITTTLAINVAPPELLSGIFLPHLYALLEQADLPADCLVIEVTEDSFITEPERARAVLLDIRAHGLQISIDDYGTGFSSLSYLRDLPVQELKMDRSFITSMREDERGRMIVSSTLQMAHALGLRTVAEGIEDAATAADLIAMGIDVLQGYYLSKPMPPEEVPAWLRARRPFGEIPAIT